MKEETKLRKKIERLEKELQAKKETISSLKRTIRVKKWYQNNKEKANKKSKDWRDNNPERDKENKRRWRLENADKVRQYARTYRKEHINEIRQYNIKKNNEKMTDEHIDKRVDVILLKVQKKKDFMSALDIDNYDDDYKADIKYIEKIKDYTE